MWVVESGSEYCSISSDGLCVTDGTDDHGSNEACVVRASQALYATATFFSTESYWDAVTIGSFAYSGLAGPTNAVMNQWDALRWSSDGYGNSGGWTICGSAAPTNWIVESGSQYCSISSDGLCVTDGAGDYGAGEACTVRTTQALFATATEFTVENNWDSVSLSGAAYSGASSPFSVPMAASDTLVWSSDSSGHGAGWTICASTTPTLWVVESGSQYCHVSSDGACVTDGSGNHGNNEACVVRAMSALYATATEFSVENYWDHVTIGGTQYSGSYSPLSVPMAAQDTLVWSSDSSGNGAGFTICGTADPIYCEPARLELARSHVLCAQPRCIRRLAAL